MRGSRPMARTARASCLRGWARLLPRPTKAVVIGAPLALRAVPPRQSSVARLGAARRRSCRLGRRIGRRRHDVSGGAALAPASSPAALALRSFLGLQHRLALGGPGIRETIPPRRAVRELPLERAASTAKIQQG